MDQQDAATKAKGLLEQTVTQRTAEWGRQIRATGDSLERIGEELRRLGVDPAADLASSGANYAQRFSSYLETADMDTLLHDAETFARRQPLVVVAGGFALGVAAARMLKVGSGRRYERYGDQPTYATPYQGKS